MSGKAGFARAKNGVAARAIAVGLMALAPAVAPVATTPAMAQVSTNFSRVDVAGNVRIEADTIRAIAGIPTNRRVAPAELNAALQALFDSGLFQNVELIPQAGRLLIEVVENPTISAIAFEGNGRINDEILGRVIELEPRQTYNVAAAEADALRIVEAYRAGGRYSAQVRPVIINRPDNRVDLVFEISEGRVTEVQRIGFVGNERYSDFRLRRAIETGEAGLLRAFFTNDTYDRDRIELDRQLLREFYLDRGYVDFQVRSVVSELARERDAFFITFNVSEGAQYRLGKLAVTSAVNGVDPSGYQGDIDVRSGQVYSASDIQDVVERIAFNLAEDGFPFTDVAPRVIRNDAERTIDIDFEVIPTARVFVERIDIEGNTETLDRVVRRQFALVEGDPLNRRDIRQAEQKIRALNIFESVNVRVREGSAGDRAVIDVDVVEKPTGSLSFGVGYSTDGGVYGSFSISDRNFLGRGQAYSAEVSVAESAQVLAFSFTEPSLLDRDLLGGFDIFYRAVDRDESSFQQTNIGFKPRVAFPVSENGRLELSYNISNDEIRDVDAGASILIVPGSQTTSSVGLAYTLDQRNSPVDPSAGYRLKVSAEYAGLGGDSQYTKAEGSIKGYASLLDEDVILSAELEAGALWYRDGPSRITDRFFLGGDSLRGFERGGVGPRDAGDALGGNTYAVGRFEASFPLGLPEELGIFGGVFYDIGTVWDLDDTAGSDGVVDDSQIWRSAAGVSLFWSTPVGPLRFNWARALEKQDYDETEDFRITLDTRF